MRIVEAAVRDRKGPALESVYKDNVIAALEKTDGCIFAGLLQSMDQPDNYVSLTLWESADKIKNYIKSGAYNDNLDQVKPYLETGSEWKIKLTKEDTLEFMPANPEPVVKSYPIEPEKTFTADSMEDTRSFLRVLSLKIKPGMQDEFKSIYKSKIQNELENTPGCRYSFLVDNSDQDKEMLSITFWDDPESITVYEQTGRFYSLLNKIKHTLSELYQWKMALDSKPDSPLLISSKDIDISKFTLVVGRNFK